MWIYKQRTGELLRTTDDPSITALMGTGYAGTGVGRNNPDMQNCCNVGPLPCGLYRIGPAQDTKNHGPLTMRLEPINGAVMYGRGGFLIHGDNREHDASEGCIIMDRFVRSVIAKSDDTLLSVVSG